MLGLTRDDVKDIVKLSPVYTAMIIAVLVVPGWLQAALYFPEAYIHWLLWGYNLFQLLLVGAGFTWFMWGMTKYPDSIRANLLGGAKYWGPGLAVLVFFSLKLILGQVPPELAKYNPVIAGLPAALFWTGALGIAWVITQGASGILGAWVNIADAWQDIGLSGVLAINEYDVFDDRGLPLWLPSVRKIIRAYLEIHVRVAEALIPWVKKVIEDRTQLWGEVPLRIPFPENFDELVEEKRIDEIYEKYGLEAIPSLSKYIRGTDAVNRGYMVEVEIDTATGLVVSAKPIAFSEIYMVGRKKPKKFILEGEKQVFRKPAGETITVHYELFNNDLVLKENWREVNKKIPDPREILDRLIQEALKQ